jgi:hypothetical protein
MDKAGRNILIVGDVAVKESNARFLLSYNIINNINNNEIYRRGHTPAASSHTVDLAAGLEGGDVAE